MPKHPSDELYELDELSDFLTRSGDVIRPFRDELSDFLSGSDSGDVAKPFRSSLAVPSLGTVIAGLGDLPFAALRSQGPSPANLVKGFENSVSGLRPEQSIDQSLFSRALIGDRYGSAFRVPLPNFATPSEDLAGFTKQQSEGFSKFLAGGGGARAAPPPDLSGPTSPRQKSEAFDAQLAEAVKPLPKKMSLYEKIAQTMQEGYNPGSPDFYRRLGMGADQRGIGIGFLSRILPQSAESRALVDEQKAADRLTEAIQGRLLEQSFAQQAQLFGAPRNFAEARNLGVDLSPTDQQLAERLLSEDPETLNTMAQTPLSEAQRFAAAGQLKSLESGQRVSPQTANQLLQGLERAGVVPRGTGGAIFSESVPTAALDTMINNLLKGAAEKQSTIATLLSNRDNAPTEQRQIYDAIIAGEEAKAEQEKSKATQLSFVRDLGSLSEETVPNAITQARNAPDAVDVAERLQSLRDVAKDKNMSPGKIQKIDEAIRENNKLIDRSRKTTTITKDAIPLEPARRAAVQQQIMSQRAAIEEGKRLLVIMNEGEFPTGVIGKASDFVNFLKGMQIDLTFSPVERAILEKTFKPNIPASKALALVFGFKLARLNNAGGTLSRQDFEVVYDTIAPSFLTTGPSAKAVVNEYIKELTESSRRDADALEEGLKKLPEKEAQKIAKSILKNNPNASDADIQEVLSELNYLPLTKSIRNIRAAMKALKEKR